jgi:methanethiol S-methyltransferase
LPEYLDFIFRFITFAAVHSTLASTRLKEIIHKKVGRKYRNYRLLYNLLSLTLFIWVMLAYRNSPVLYFVPGIWSLSMYLLQLILAVALFKCLQQTNVSDFFGFKEWKQQNIKAALVTDGFYGVVRHPLYLLSILFLVFNPVMTVQWALLTICSTIYFIVGARIEEKRFIKDFGDEYRKYKQTVPFMLPKFRGFIS